MIEIKIPFKTPTINHLYGRAGIRTFVTKTAKEMRVEICRLIDEQGLAYSPEILGKKLSVTVEIYEDWFTKKGEVKRKDVANREKFLIDSISEAMGFDDKFIFEHAMKKKQSVKEYAVVKIEVLE